jgi:transposase
MSQPLTTGRRTRTKWFGSDHRLLKEWDHSSDIRLVFDQFDFFLLFPIRSSKDAESAVKRGLVAVDPGNRTFATSYSEREAVQFKTNRELIWRLQAKIDRLRSLRQRHLIRNNNAWKKIHRNGQRIRNMVDDLHWQTCAYLTRNYQAIILPPFEIQKLKANRLNARVNRDYDTFAHYRFKMRLREKCRTSGTGLYVCGEEYTSKTCGVCGKLNHHLGSAEIFKCSHCSSVFERDPSSARNILIKNIREKTRIKLRLRRI